MIWRDLYCVCWTVGVVKKGKCIKYICYFLKNVNRFFERHKKYKLKIYIIIFPLIKSHTGGITETIKQASNN